MFYEFVKTNGHYYTDISEYVKNKMIARGIDIKNISEPEYRKYFFEFSKNLTELNNETIFVENKEFEKLRKEYFELLNKQMTFQF